MCQIDEPNGCACGSMYSDLMTASPQKSDWLRRTAFPRCKKVYWTNKETDYCMDCEPPAIEQFFNGDFT